MLVKRLAAPIREQTTNNIRDAIIQGEFHPGQRLYEKELCERTSVSRTSIREALRQLESEGIVTVIPNKGTCVAKLSYDEVKEIYEVRRVLESFAVKLFAERATETQIKKLETVVNRLERTFQAGRHEDLVKIKDQFYKVLLEGSKNQLIASFLNSINARTAFLRNMSLSSAGRPPKSIQEIKEILKHLQNRNSQGAWQASFDHVGRAQDAALKVLQSDLDRTAELD